MAGVNSQAQGVVQHYNKQSIIVQWSPAINLTMIQSNTKGLQQPINLIIEQ